MSDAAVNQTRIPLLDETVADVFALQYAASELNRRSDMHDSRIKLALIIASASVGMNIALTIALILQ